MTTKITPNGIVLLIEHEGKTYHGYLQNDFDRFKTYGNYDLSTDTLILFDEDFNKISFENTDTCDLYDKIEELIEKFVIREEDEDEDDEESDRINRINTL